MRNNYTREEKKQQRNLTVAIVFWAVLLVAAVVSWVVRL